jgi:hypothetical protein
MAFTFHSDAAHGWLEVSADDLAALNLSPRIFTKYSYRKGNRFFLEEDCDANKFFAVYIKKYGALPEIHDEYQHTSFVRSLQRVAA